MLESLKYTAGNRRSGYTLPVRIDLEYQKEHNESTDGQALVDLVLALTAARLQVIAHEAIETYMCRVLKAA